MEEESSYGIDYLRAEERTNYPCSLSVDDLGEQFALVAQTASTVDPLRVCEFMQTALQRLVDALDNCPEAEVCSLDVLPSSERQQLLYGWNDTGREYPSEQCIHQLFEEQVERTPSATAVVFEDQSLSYAELNERSNRLAHHLRTLGVKPDTRVAICVERSLEMMVGLLAILKAGGAYVPLDPAYPVERLRFMLQDSAPVALLTQEHLVGLFADVAEVLPVLDLGVATPPWDEMPVSNPDPGAVGLTSRHLAYIIYTSGSTGMPKGVMVEHRGGCNTLLHALKVVGLRNDDVIAAIASSAFDISLLEMLTALLGGACTLILSRAAVLDMDLFLQRARVVTVLQAVPVLMSEVVRAQQRAGSSAKLSNLRIVLPGGDRVAASLVGLLQDVFSGTDVRVTYGPTEASMICTTTDLLCSGSADEDPPIGRPISNTQIYILDGSGEPCPIGVAGELYIGGAGVARGYLNRPELTAERFVRNPFVDDPGARMYRTGDLGYWLSDGNIAFVGRNDFQVKIRGFRIELGEIEARLSEHPGIRDAVVVAREDVPGDKRLVAYFTTTSEGQGTVSAEQLRSHLSSCVPEYMVPAAYVRVEEFPLTPNGKLNRKGLPAPDGEAYVTRVYEAPQTENEAVLAAIWQEVLKVDCVGRQDNFFELGGHSLLAVTLIERIRRAGFRVDVRTLFTAPTLSALAASAGKDSEEISVPPNLIPSACSLITPEMLSLVSLTQEEIDRIVGVISGGAANVQDIYPLAPLQEGFLFHHLMEPEKDPYVLGVQMSFESRAQLDRYLDALQAVIDRHDILRTAVLWEGLSEPVQVVLREATLPVDWVQFDDAGGDIGEQMYTRFDPRRVRIDLRQAPLLRAYAAEDPEKQRWILLLLHHHLLGDHTALEMMQAEIKAHLSGKAQELGRPYAFRNLVAQARLGVSREEHEKFFQGMLGDVEEPTAPFGLLDAHGDGTEIRDAGVFLDIRLSGRLRRHARRLGISAASICHLAWAQVLARATGRRDVVFGTVLFGRMQGGEGADRVMGPFINTLPVRIMSAGEGVEDAVRKTHTASGRPAASRACFSGAGAALQRSACSGAAVHLSAQLSPYLQIGPVLYGRRERIRDRLSSRRGAHQLSLHALGGRSRASSLRWWLRRRVRWIRCGSANSCRPHCSDWSMRLITVPRRKSAVWMFFLPRNVSSCCMDGTTRGGSTLRNSAFISCLRSRWRGRRRRRRWYLKISL